MWPLLLLVAAAGGGYWYYEKNKVGTTTPSTSTTATLTDIKANGPAVAPTATSQTGTIPLLFVFSDGSQIAFNAPVSAGQVQAEIASPGSTAATMKQNFMAAGAPPITYAVLQSRLAGYQPVPTTTTSGMVGQLTVPGGFVGHQHRHDGHGIVGAGHGGGHHGGGHHGHHGGHGYPYPVGGWGGGDGYGGDDIDINIYNDGLDRNEEPSSQR